MLAELLLATVAEVMFVVVVVVVLVEEVVAVVVEVEVVLAVTGTPPVGVSSARIRKTNPQGTRRQSERASETKTYGRTEREHNGAHIPGGGGKLNQNREQQNYEKE